MAALSLESKRDPLRGAWPLIACEAYTLRCWYVTDGPMQEALIARDALESALHLQSANLAPFGIFANWVECVDARTMFLSDINKHQAFLQFSVIA